MVSDASGLLFESLNVAFDSQCVFLTKTPYSFQIRAEPLRFYSLQDSIFGLNNTQISIILSLFYTTLSLYMYSAAHELQNSTIVVATA